MRDFRRKRRGKLTSNSLKGYCWLQATDKKKASFYGSCFFKKQWRSLEKSSVTVRPSVKPRTSKVSEDIVIDKYSTVMYVLWLVVRFMTTAMATAMARFASLNLIGHLISRYGSHSLSRLHCPHCRRVAEKLQKSGKKRRRRKRSLFRILYKGSHSKKSGVYIRSRFVPGKRAPLINFESQRQQQQRRRCRQHAQRAFVTRAPAMISSRLRNTI